MPTLPTKDVTFFSPRGAVSHARRPLPDAGVGVSRQSHADPERAASPLRGRQPDHATPIPLLDPETLTGVEGGVLTQFGRASVRATAFFNNLDGAIANVTLSQTPTQIMRQRQNSDTIRATGVELELDARFTNTLSASGAGRVHVEPLPRLGGDAGDRGQRRAAGAEGAGRRGADLGGSALVHRRDADALQRRAVRRRPQHRGVRAGRLRACGTRRSAARSCAA